MPSYSLYWDEEIASNMCPLDEPFGDSLIVVDRETVV